MAGIRCQKPDKHALPVFPFAKSRDIYQDGLVS
jgi:hypothetical protein